MALFFGRTMKLVILFVFVAATIVGVAMQSMPSSLERKLAKIDQELAAKLKKIDEETAVKLAKIEEESRILQQKFDAFVKRAEDCVREAVLSRLKAPATAQFGPIEFRNPPWVPDNVLNLKMWVGYGYVDSENSYGALLRQNYEVCIYVNEETRRWEPSGSVKFLGN
jgi:hypothetical protein